MPNISEKIQEATRTLRTSGVSEPHRDARSLLVLALKRDRTFLIARPEYQLTAAEEQRFSDFIKRRSGREPFQHIAGKQEFRGLDFMVSPDVLIPRPETEMIVEAAIEILQTSKIPRFCEIGIGSGCISISILHEIRPATAIGLDISEKALRIAQTNAGNNKVSERLELKVSDVFENLPGGEKFELIVSNPPYVPLKEIPHLQSEVRDFDPLIALTDGKDGLSIIRRIIDESPLFLKKRGFLLLEIGFDQSAGVRQMFDPSIWQSPEVFPDLRGIPRMVKARIKDQRNPKER